MLKCFFSFLVIFASCDSSVKKSITPEISQKDTGAIKEKLSDSALFELVQKQTFKYFWDGAEPTSGLARERFHVDNIYEENDKNTVTSGGSGFGVMAILVAIERG